MSEPAEETHEEEPQELVESEERKPGQKFQTPSPGFADRVFYERYPPLVSFHGKARQI